MHDASPGAISDRVRTRINLIIELEQSEGSIIEYKTLLTVFIGSPAIHAYPERE